MNDVSVTDGAWDTTVRRSQRLESEVRAGQPDGWLDYVPADLPSWMGTSARVAVSQRKSASAPSEAGLSTATVSRV
jgi:hypothetical protein